MQTQRDIILIIIVLGVFLFGYFLVSKIDSFLEESRKAIEEENKKKEPSCIILTEDMSDEEIIKEIKKFRGKHDKTRILIYDSSDAELFEGAEHYSD